MNCENCDFVERLKQLQETKPEERLYGKKQLISHEKYDLIDKDGIIDGTRTQRLYAMFVYNVLTLLKAGIFKYKWVHPSELLTATKGKIWDWTSDEEKQNTIESIEKYGLFFPIFTLDKGILHNQVDELEPGTYEDKYNSYNGNHRIDALQGIGKGKVLIIIIPEFCEKSCTGFKYTPIDYSNPCSLPNMVTSNPTECVELFHLRLLEDEMKMYSLPTKTKDTWPGVDIVHCIDYQSEFRILQEFQNALEVPLHINSTVLRSKNDIFNYEKTMEGFLSDPRSHCPYMSELLTCFLLEQAPRTCGIYACCNICPKRHGCKDLCEYAESPE